MKSYTDLEQSKKLAGFLPVESADQTWEGDGSLIPGSILNMSKEPQYKHQGDTPFKFYSGVGLPCWSLAALLDIIPSGQVNKVIDSNKWESSAWNGTDFEPMLTVGDFDSPVDACVEMILALKEKDLL